MKTFNVLKEVSGSPGVTRAFNSHGQVVWQATFTDGASGAEAKARSASNRLAAESAAETERIRTEAEIASRRSASKLRPPMPSIPP